MEYTMNDFIRGWSRRSENQDIPMALSTDILLAQYGVSIEKNN